MQNQDNHNSDPLPSSDIWDASSPLCNGTGDFHANLGCRKFKSDVSRTPFVPTVLEYLDSFDTFFQVIDVL
jgi:hypothetical protein